MRKIAIVNLSTMDGEDVEVLRSKDPSNRFWLLSPGEFVVVDPVIDGQQFTMTNSGPSHTLATSIETPTIQGGQRQDVKVIPVLDVFFVREQKPEQFERGQK